MWTLSSHLKELSQTDLFLQHCWSFWVCLPLWHHWLSIFALVICLLLSYFQMRFIPFHPLLQDFLFTNWLLKLAMAIANFFVSNSPFPCEMTQENDGRPSTHFATLDFSIWFPPLTSAFFLSPWVLQQPYQSLCGSNADENCLLLHLGLASQHQSWLRALIIAYSILFAALGVGT